jgi:hypothetical protein
MSRFTGARRAAFVAVDHEQLVGLRRQLLEPAQAQHRLERHVGADLHNLEIHQRADHVVSKDMAARGCSRSSTGRLEKTSSITSLRQVGRELGDLGVERLRRRDQLLGVHRGDERLMNRIGPRAGSRRRDRP